MARVQYSGIIDNIRGSIGSTTFQEGKSGAIIRSKPLNIRTPSILQNNKIVNFSNGAKAWRALTLAQQQGWEALAAANPKLDYFGETKTLSGYQYFLSCYNNAKQLNGTPLTNAPTYRAPVAVPTFTIIASTSVLQISFSPAFNTSPGAIVIFATPPVNSSSLLQRSNLRYIDAGPPATWNTIGISTQWRNKFGFSSIPSPGGSRYFIQISVCTIDVGTFINSAFTSNIGVVTA